MKLLNYKDKNIVEAGCDEAGRGCLAGPVYAAAVILPPDFEDPLLNDSKKMKPQDRNLLRKIIENKAIAYSVAYVNSSEIDKINILQSSLKAMHLAISQLKITPQQLLIDGNRFLKSYAIPYHCIIKGDGKYASIAAASILAKSYRDEYMLDLHQKYPHYNWDTNKAYPTAKHIAAIMKYGVCKHHRLSFMNLNQQQKLEI